MTDGRRGEKRQREVLLMFGTGRSFEVERVKVEFLPPVAKFTLEAVGTPLEVFTNAGSVLPVGTGLGQLARKIRPFEILPVMGVEASEGIVPLPGERAKLAFEVEKKKIGVDGQQVEGLEFQLCLRVGGRTSLAEPTTPLCQKLPAKFPLVERRVVLFLNYVQGETAVWLPAGVWTPGCEVSISQKRPP